MTDSLPARPQPEIRAVIFDMDGVIVDSEPWWHAVRAEWAAALGKTWTNEDSHACMGLNSHDWSVVMGERMAVGVSREEIEAAIVERLVHRYAELPTPRIEGAAEAVRRIAGELPSAIASGAHKDVIAAAVHAAGLDGVLREVISCDEVQRGKPAPDVYLEAARRLGVAPEHCLVIEDSFNGVVAGKEAGMTVVLVPNPSFPPRPGTEAIADVVRPRLADLDPLAPFAPSA